MMDLLEYYTWTKFFTQDLYEVSDSDSEYYSCMEAWNKSWALRLKIQEGVS